VVLLNNLISPAWILVCFSLQGSVFLHYMLVLV
jgi:hypothetical protein